MTAEHSSEEGGEGLSEAERYAPTVECQGCGVHGSDDGADSLLGWSRDEAGELSFCAKCGAGELGPPPERVVNRLHKGAARYRAFKDLLHEHREDALICYDHPGHHCCVCGEHLTLGFREHLAAVLAARAESAEAERDDLRGRLAAVETLADDNRAWAWTAPVGPGNASYANGYENGRRSLAEDLRAALANPSAAQGEGEGK